MADAPTAPLTPLQRAFLALEEARTRVAALEARGREPIAVVGLGLRTPGGVRDADAFWRLLAEGVDATGEIPDGRWDHARYYDPDPERPGCIATRRGGFLDAIDRFDAGFFGISPREADRMDPQQRLLLTVAWEALEHAGQDPLGLEESRTGVYVGVTGSDYAYLQLADQAGGSLDAHFASGIAHSIVSGRISYLLGLRGPSLTIDTACSSSLVAIHLAMQGLRAGECRTALAGGVNLILAPDIFVSLSQARMLSPDGRCKAFAASADGFARAEGCGMLVLKRLADAQADGDRVLAVLAGSAVNQDGVSSSLTAPNGLAQEAVIREALANAGLSPRDVGLIEAHGTGTELGDPIEAKAIGAVFGADRDPADPVLLGSVKTNIGHAEAAAGVLGVIKAVLSVHRRAVPAHLHWDEPSPHIPWSRMPLEIPRATRPWHPDRGRRIAGVSSFGFSGTNAHVIVAEASPATSGPAAAPAARPRLLALSARTADTLAETARSVACRLADDPGLDLGDVARTLNAGRAHFAHRATLLAATTREAAQGLQALAAGEVAPRLRQAHVIRRDPPRIAFLFTGQGSQYPSLSRNLYETCLPYRAALDRCAALLEPHLDRPLTDLLFSDDPVLLDRTVYTQPALFAVEYALAETWRAWGVTPNVVLGHSVGEYVAATVAGVIDLADALRLIAARGRLMQSLVPGGSMAAVYGPEAVVAAAIAESRLPVSIAAVNGPVQTVISGAVAAVEALGTRLGADGLKVTRLPVSHAFHSALVDPVLAAFEREASGIRFSPPQLRMISNLTGRTATGAEVTRGAYWRDHMRQPVRFADGLAALAETKPGLCIEIGPHPALLSFASAAFGTSAPPLLPSLRRGRPDLEQMLDSLGAAYLAGAPVAWRAVDPDGRVVDLPGQATRPERHWFSAAPRSRPRAPATERQGLPGTRLRLAAGAVFQAAVAIDRPDFVRQHRVQGRAVLPATAYLAGLVEVARHLRAGRPWQLEQITIREAMLLDEDGAARTVQTVCEPDRPDTVQVTISSQAEDAPADADWTQHLTAKLVPATAGTETATLAAARAACGAEESVSSLYAGFAALGLDFGPGFRTVRRLWCGSSEALGEIVADPAGADARSGDVDPVLLDGCLQVVAAALPAEARNHLHLPVGLDRVAVRGPVRGRCFSHVVLRSAGPGSASADIRVFDAEGDPVATLTGLHLQRVDAEALARLGAREAADCLYETTWQPIPPPAAAPVLPEPGSLAATAAAALPGLAGDTDLAAYDRANAALESLCVDMTCAALRALGLSFQPGTLIPGPELGDRLGVLPRHRRLLARLLAILAEDGILDAAPDGWRVVRDPGSPDIAAAIRALEHGAPLIRIELGMTARVAGGLADALRGRRDPAELLFPGGATDEAERLYRDSPSARLFNGLMSEILAAVAAARTAGRPLRILEVGAGTGGTTAHVLPRLPDDVTYTFTDVGPAFVARARDRFGARAGMQFATLDLERDPGLQGFPGKHYDLIIASNVVHATADIARTLARLRSLLVPGGLVALLEVTAPQRWFDLTVGLTEGWWAFEDTDLRAGYPTLAADQWRRVLPAAGFESVSAVPATPGSGLLSRQAIFLARAKGRSWLVFEDGERALARVTADLRARGDTCRVVRPGPYRHDGATTWLEADRAEDYRRLMSDLAASGCLPDGVIHGWALDIAPDAVPGEASGQGVLGLTYLSQALVSVTPAPRTWVVTRGGQWIGEGSVASAPLQAAPWGLGRTLALEHPELGFTCLDLDEDGLGRLVTELDSDATERDVAWRSGARFGARLKRRQTALPAGRDDEPWRLVPSRTGSIEAFERVPLLRRRPAPDEVEIAVAASGLNFKDVLNALDLYPGEGGPLGAECAGTVVAVGADVRHVAVGDPVMAVIGGSFASHVVAKAELVQRRPETVGPEEGASFPVAYLTAAFCLDQVAQLRGGETVLIHAAAGGVGLAAVRLALRTGATVLATAGSPAKRHLLRGLGVTQVFDSRSAAFAAEVRRATGGRGVDVVLNSLGGDLVEPSFAAIADGGRFVEIGKRGIKDPAWVAALERGIAYTIVDWGDTAAREPARIGALFAALTADLAAGRLPALPRHTFPLERVRDAFRLMAQAGHVGRIVVSHAGAPAAPLARRDGTYLITGGLSGLGLATARHLVEAGAGRVVLAGRRGMTAEAQEAVAAMRQVGADVVTECLDVADPEAVERLLARLRAAGPPLRGVVHAAGVLANRGLQQLEAASFAAVMAPKVDGALALDTLTRADPLDWFALFASIAGVLGAPGQANHAAANAVLDQIARRRRAGGLPAVSIDWGAWSAIGAAASLTGQMAAQGLGALTPERGLAVFERLVTGDAVQVIAAPMDWPRYRGHLGPAVHAALLSGLDILSEAVPTGRSARIEAPAEDFLCALEEAPPARRRKMIAARVRDLLLRALGMDPARPVDPQMAFGELGLDSLLSVELRNRLAVTFDRSFPATLLFDHPTLDAITDFLLAEVAGTAPADGGADTRPTIVAEIEGLSDDEVDRMLRAKFGVSV
jgi:acyl transferase domain-containing protein/NADPH:quinone reductase-like Zn-dependent oxidoreductase/NAD(P)-dependent dehydrogenase (short-subunit alcohol dehydrogenase family)/SAM-dependent methyltransferase/acyl carrier protein